MTGNRRPFRSNSPLSIVRGIKTAKLARSCPAATPEDQRGGPIPTTAISNAPEAER